MNKKAQGISINTIIIAAIALAVLVVLFAIFTGRIGIFSSGVKDTDNCFQKCESLGLPRRQDLDQNQCAQQSGTFIAAKFSDTPQNGCCCTPK